MHPIRTRHGGHRQWSTANQDAEHDTQKNKKINYGEIIPLLHEDAKPYKPEAQVQIFSKETQN